MDAEPAVRSLHQKLRQLAPHRVRMYTNASDEQAFRDLAVPGGRKKWRPILDIVEAHNWHRIELLDRAGLILGEVRREAEPAGELEEIGTGAMPRELGAVPMLVRWIVSEIIRAQREALTFRDREHVQLLQSMAEMLRVNTEAVRQLAQVYRAQVDASMEVAAMRAELEAGGDMGQIVKLLEASPELLTKLGPIVGMLTRRFSPPAPAAPRPTAPNGAKS